MEWINAVSGPGIQVVGALAVADNGDLVVLGGYLDDADFDADGRIESASKCHQLGDVFLALYEREADAMAPWLF